MATSKEYKNYILELLSNLEDITSKPMMGEYLLYYKDILFGGIYDDKFLIKETKSNNKYQLKEEIPYTNAKKMYLLDSENQDFIKEIIIKTYEDLKK